MTQIIMVLVAIICGCSAANVINSADQRNGGEGIAIYWFPIIAIVCTAFTTVLLYVHWIAGAIVLVVMAVLVFIGTSDATTLLTANGFFTFPLMAATIFSMVRPWRWNKLTVQQGAMIGIVVLLWIAVVISGFIKIWICRSSETTTVADVE